MTVIKNLFLKNLGGLGSGSPKGCDDKKNTNVA